jgi:hypothetical protein
MDKKRLIVKIIGWIFIIGAFAYLFNILLPKRLPAWFENFIYSFLFKHKPLSQGFLNILSDILIGLLFSSLIFAAGWGILKLKPWARVLALFVLIGEILYKIFIIFVLDPIFYNEGISFMFLAFYILLLITLLLPFFKKQFPPSIRFKDFDIWAIFAINIALLKAIIFLVINIILLFGSIIFREPFKRIPDPVKVRYSVENMQYIKEECSELEIFGFSLFLPKELEVSSFARHGENSEKKSFVLFFNFQGKDRGKGYGIISSESAGEEFLPFYWKESSFNAYEIEKRSLYRSRWLTVQILSPTFFVAMTDWDIIEDVSSDNWIGFVKQDKRECEGKVSWTLECSAYSKDLKKSAGITLIFRDEDITINQVKSILATLKFLEQTKNADEYFRLGNKEKERENYKEAKLNFLNALYLEPENPKYNYNMALLLYEIYEKEKEDNSDTKKELSLLEIKTFLTYALEVDPEHKEAKKLIDLIE